MQHLQQHLRAAKDSWQQMKLHFWSNGFTMVVIGIALTLPVVLTVILSNLQEVTRSWNVGNQMTVFLKDSTSDADAQKLANQFKLHKGVERVEYLNKEETLKEFREHSGFAEAIELLPTNPLPAIIVIHPRVGGISNQDLTQWAAQLKSLPTVDLVQLDQDWLQRLNALINVAERGILIIGILLFVAIALIIGNTIRLLIENRHEEIALISIMGGTPPFVRRPFLYTGIWFGFCGGILSCILVNLGLLTLQQPIGQLASLYHSSFILSGMSFGLMINVLLLSMLAGWFSAYVVVTHYLRRLVISQ
ncbi:MAG: permease-like cell division protein FtsX [Gammaproteobacteria bacterium]